MLRGFKDGFALGSKSNKLKVQNTPIMDFTSRLIINFSHYEGCSWVRNIKIWHDNNTTLAPFYFSIPWTPTHSKKNDHLRLTSLTWPHRISNLSILIYLFVHSIWTYFVSLLRLNASLKLWLGLDMPLTTNSLSTMAKWAFSFPLSDDRGPPNHITISPRS